MNESFDRPPIKREAGRNNQFLIGDTAAARERDALLVRLKRNNRILNPFDAGGHDALHCPACLLRREDTGTNHCPSRLVVMHISGLDDCDVEITHTRQQTRGDGDARSAASDNDNLVFGWPGSCLTIRSGILRCYRPVLWTSRQSGGRDASAARAIAEDRFGQFGDRPAESNDIRVSHPAGHNRNVPGFEP